ncbi:MAG: hypothetical protein D6796_16165, partial [Caldilineae bacterium]
MRTHRFFLLAVALLAMLSSWPPPPRPSYRLAFASDRAGNGDIFLADAWGRLTNLTRSPDGDWSPRWSPDGTRIAFTSHRAGQSDIWLMDAGGGNPVNLTRHPAWDYAPAWSPDGTQIAFISERDGDPEIFVQSLTGDDARQLTFNDYPDKLPAWSPDGTQIAFAAIINGVEQIYLLNRRDGDAIAPLLPPKLNGTNPVWKPDGSAIAFVGWETPDAIRLYTLDLRTGRLQPRYTDTAWIGSLNWSADGRWLFFTGRKGGNHDLFALRLSDGAVYRLTGDPAWDDFPALRPGDP